MPPSAPCFWLVPVSGQSSGRVTRCVEVALYPSVWSLPALLSADGLLEWSSAGEHWAGFLLLGSMQLVGRVPSSGLHAAGGNSQHGHVLPAHGPPRQLLGNLLGYTVIPYPALPSGEISSYLNLLCSIGRAPNWPAGRMCQALFYFSPWQAAVAPTVAGAARAMRASPENLQAKPLPTCLQ